MRNKINVFLSYILIVLTILSTSIPVLATNNEICLQDDIQYIFPTQQELAVEHTNTIKELGILDDILNEQITINSQVTRLNGTIIFLRIIGEEKMAEKSNYESTFTDVPDWANKYIAYACNKGYVNGETDTIFGADTLITENEYIGYILKATGYTEESLNGLPPFEVARMLYAAFLPQNWTTKTEGIFTYEDCADISFYALSTYNGLKDNKTFGHFFKESLDEPVNLFEYGITDGEILVSENKDYKVRKDFYGFKVANYKLNTMDATEGATKYFLIENPPDAVKGSIIGDLQNNVRPNLIALKANTKVKTITENTILTFRTGDWFVFLNNDNNIVSYGYVFIYFNGESYVSVTVTRKMEEKTSGFISKALTRIENLNNLTKDDVFIGIFKSKDDNSESYNIMFSDEFLNTEIGQKFKFVGYLTFDAKDEEESIRYFHNYLTRQKEFTFEHLTYLKNKDNVYPLHIPKEYVYICIYDSNMNLLGYYNVNKNGELNYIPQEGFVYWENLS